MTTTEPRTKIVATLGPASEQPPVLDELLAAGVDVVRLNLSHGTLESHLERLRSVRAAAERVGQVVAVLADLPGPKVRSGQFPDGGVELVNGSSVRLVPDHNEGRGTSDASTISVEYSSLLADLLPGDLVVLGDGAISLSVDSVDEHAVHCRVRTGGRVQGRPGVHIPSERLRLSTPTDEDLVLGRAMAESGADFLAVSFVRSAHDLRVMREAVAPMQVRLVAKVETMSAIAGLDEIIAEADAVMVARGDLGIECPMEDVPHLQKQIVRHCVERAVPVITATQMLESMINAPAPTRAEVSDVANAVFDGTDAVMLSGETAIGVDPVGVVTTMARIAARAESEAAYGRWLDDPGRENGAEELHELVAASWDPSAPGAIWRIRYHLVDEATGDPRCVGANPYDLGGNIVTAACGAPFGTGTASAVATSLTSTTTSAAGGYFLSRPTPPTDAALHHVAPPAVPAGPFRGHHGDVFHDPVRAGRPVHGGKGGDARDPAQPRGPLRPR